MARGDQRRGAKVRKGAAPKRRGTTSLGKAPAAGAAPEHSPRGRGRPPIHIAPPIAVAGDPELAARLMTPEGRRSTMAGLARWAMGNNLGREQVAKGELLRKLCGEFRDEHAAEDLPNRIADLEAQVEQLLEAVAGKKGSALRADTAVVPPMKSEVEDPIGTDMAPTPPLPRGGEPYQS